MYKVGPLNRGYWQVEFNNGMIVTQLSNGPVAGSNDWIRLWCDGAYLEGNDWTDLRILINQPIDFELEEYTPNKVCECGATKVGSPRHSQWCDLND